MTNNQGLIHTTLVPIDFSENSFLAMDHAVALSKVVIENKGHITLLHVIEGSDFNSVSDSFEVETGSRDALAIEGAFNRLRKLAEKNQNATKSTFTCVVAGGKAYKKIAEVAELINSDVIVMGTHGSSGVQAFAGSNASKVIQIAPCPVVVVKEKRYAGSYKNIVLPLDLTVETKQKVNTAVKIAEYYKATIHIVTMSSSDEFLSRRLTANLAQVEGYLEDRGIAYTTSILEGNFVSNTISFAKAKNADLIIIMAERDRGFTEYIFGTMAQQIVNRSSIPVMAVKPDEKLAGVLDATLGTGVYSH
jgi:nucleotide-binding universal stress UspA family protein